MPIHRGGFLGSASRCLIREQDDVSGIGHVRVGIDLTHCFGRAGGIHRYAIEIAKALSADPGRHEYLVFVRQAPPAALVATGLDFVISPWRRHLFAEQLWLPLAAKRFRLDLLHLTGFPGPLHYEGRTVSTVFDATASLFPATMRRRDRTYWRHVLPWTARRSQTVITTSASAADDVVRHHGVERDRIRVIHLAVAAELADLVGAPSTNSLENWHLPERFILGVSALDPRKNFARLIEAYHQFIRAHSHRDSPHLVIAGPGGWLYDELFKLVADFRLTDRVHFSLRSPSDNQLAELYSRAVCLAYPSLYEGFGLPPIEAMAFGCPVLTSNVASLPEVVGDAALLVDPLDVHAIARGLEELVTNGVLREQLIRRGRQRAGDFSWARAARETRAVYEQAVGMDLGSRHRSPHRAKRSALR